jgi:hypothetical protein
MQQIAQSEFEFQGHYGRRVTADFKGGHQTSDGGCLLLREQLLLHGLPEKLAKCFEDFRNPRFVRHRLPTMLAQRITGLALGYEDLNDHEQLRHDPAFVLLAGNKDLVCSDQGHPLAGKSTLNRLEQGAKPEQDKFKYRKIQPCADQIEELLLSEGVKAIPRKTHEIVLDFDATDDLVHGMQEGRYYHGYYGDYCYLPLYCFCGDIPLWAQLRSADRDASLGTDVALEKIVRAIRKRFGRKVRIIVRGDGGFARESIMSWCEQNKVHYCFGLSRNPRLSKELDGAYEKMETRIQEGKLTSPCRRFLQFQYQTLDSWSRTRRIVGKAELIWEKRNSRFVVTNLPPQGFPGDPHGRFAPRSLYQGFYCARGDMENRIKEQQMDLFADRTSCHTMASNQLRLWFSAFAHLVMARLREGALQGTELSRASIGTIRLKLFKVCARITLTTRRIHLSLPSSYPWQNLFVATLRNIQAGFS